MPRSDRDLSYKSAIIYFTVFTSVGQYYLSCSGLNFQTVEEARIIVFKEPIPNKVMRGHVIRRESVPNEGSCRVKCYMEPNCMSINMGPLTGGKIKCELNNATAENEFVFDLRTKDAHTYLAIENPCSSSSCLNNGTCQAGFTSKGFRCKCLPGFSGTKCRAAKSCSHLKRIEPRAESGSYVIDPDGEGGLLPMYDVICNMTDKNGIGVTVISHDSENRTHVKGYEAPGSYSRDIHYTGASLSQLESLTRVSLHCEQFIKYECYHSVLLYSGYEYGWWVSRGDDKMTYWGGASEDGKCACGINKTCANRNHGCNYVKNDNVWREDSGLLTDKAKLPVKQLRFGDTGHLDKQETGYHTLGKLKCYGIA